MMASPTRVSSEDLVLLLEALDPIDAQLLVGGEGGLLGLGKGRAPLRLRGGEALQLAAGDPSAHLHWARQLAKRVRDQP